MPKNLRVDTQLSEMPAKKRKVKKTWSDKNEKQLQKYLDRKRQGNNTAKDAKVFKRLMVKAYVCDNYEGIDLSAWPTYDIVKIIVSLVKSRLKQHEGKELTPRSALFKVYCAITDLPIKFNSYDSLERRYQITPTWPKKAKDDKDIYGMSWDLMLPSNFGIFAYDCCQAWKFKVGNQLVQPHPDGMGQVLLAGEFDEKDFY